jgi:hypothetical protein
MKTEFGNALNLAQAAVEAVETISTGHPFAEAVAAARESLQDVERICLATLFPSFTGASADHVALFVFLEEGMARLNVAEEFARVHGEALRADAGFAAFLRSDAVCRRVASVYAAAVPGGERAPLYRRLIAEQLADAGQSAPHAEVYARDLATLRQRLDDVEVKHREYLETESRRVEAVERRALAAAAAAEQANRQALAEFFSSRGQQSFLFRGWVFTGADIAKHLHGGAPLIERSGGTLLIGVSICLDEADQLRRQVMAGATQA